MEHYSAEQVQRYTTDLEKARLKWRYGLTEDEFKEFRKTYDSLIESVLEEKVYSSNPKCLDRLKRILEYAALITYSCSGPLTVSLYKGMCKLEGIEPNMRLASVAGLCVELCQAVILVIDDIQDSSKTRMLQPCWYLECGPGIAAMDALFLESANFLVIEKYFQDKEYYPKLVKLFQDHMRLVVYGQTVDSHSGTKSVNELFDEVIFEHRCLYTSTYIGFLLPMEIALLMTGRHDPDAEDTMHQIMKHIAEYCRYLNDIKDFSADPDLWGKIGTDIQSNRCTWPFMTAMKLANEKQRRIITDNYGRAGANHVIAVQQVYQDLQILEEFAKWERRTFAEINSLCRKLPQELQEPLRSTCNMLHGKEIY